MIANRNFVIDVFVHFVIITLLSMYIRHLSTIQDDLIITNSLIIAIVISLINHIFLPNFRLSRFLY